MSDIGKEVARIVAAGALGRSPAYERLLRYLAKCSSDNTKPKEIDIARDVFAREDFDPSNDSTVRVYLHNLRQKMDAFYAGDDSATNQRLLIPKGDYRVVFAAAQPDVIQSDASQAVAKRSLVSPLIVGLVLVASALAFFIGRASVITDASVVEQLAQSPLWEPLLDDDLPITIVVGDYYVFGERNNFGMLDRLIRDFGINNKADFDAYVSEEPSRAESYEDVRLTYLPTGVGAALNDILKVPHRTGKTVTVIPQSDFSTAIMRANHVIYVGYLSGMESLSQYAFEASRLKLGSS